VKIQWRNLSKWAYLAPNRKSVLLGAQDVIPDYYLCVKDWKAACPAYLKLRKQICKKWIKGSEEI
jgi:hypothetical protein